MRSEEYWGNIRATLQGFCRPDDQLHCNTILDRPGQSCQMCGYRPIRWNHILENERTEERLVVGSECIHNYRVEFEKMGYKTPPVIFPARYRKEAEFINEKWPDTVQVEEMLDDMEEGLEPWVTPEEELREYRRGLGLGVDEDDIEGMLEEEREELLDMGLDPDDPDFHDLAPHGMEGDLDDDEDEDGELDEELAVYNKFDEDDDVFEEEDDDSDEYLEVESDDDDY